MNKDNIEYRELKPKIVKCKHGNTHEVYCVHELILPYDCHNICLSKKRDSENVADNSL